MEIVNIIGIAVSLAMDAFAVSIIAGATISPFNYRHSLRLSWHFGFFQFFMPLIGWLGGTTVVSYIKDIDHWIAFGVLLFIGLHMIIEALSGTERPRTDISRGWHLISLSLATSIDALAVGFAFSLIGSPILFPSIIIGVTAFIFSLFGTYLGKKSGKLFGNTFEIIGGCMLILIGLRILISHLTEV